MTTSSPDPHTPPTPTAQIADASLRIIGDLKALEQRDGEAAMIVEAMAMHGAALTVLRPAIGTGHVRLMLDQAQDENDRVEARDDRIRSERDRCRAAQAERATKP